MLFARTVQAKHIIFQPAKVAQSLLLFCQGQGQLTSLPPPGVERRMSRAMSMEEYDRPNIRRLSLTPHAAESPPRRP
ncbi:unnamed protein product, partial [Iphiclides podalirius]